MTSDVIYSGGGSCNCWEYYEKVRTACQNVNHCSPSLPDGVPRGPLAPPARPASVEQKWFHEFNQVMLQVLATGSKVGRGRHHVNPPQTDRHTHTHTYAHPYTFGRANLWDRSICSEGHL